MRLSFIALALVAGVSASPAFATVNLVTNGDFTDLTNGVGELAHGQTSAVGWTTTGYNAVLAVADQAVNTQYGKANLALWDAKNGGSNTWNGAAPVGNFLALDGDFDVAAVSQIVHGLTVGEKYAVNFDYAFSQQHGYSGPTVQSLSVSMGSTSMRTANYDLGNHGFSGWSAGVLSFTATSSSETLSFLAHGNLPVPPFALVSDVSVSAGVPEPSTWALLLCGFVGLAYAGRRSSRRRSSIGEPVAAA